MADPMDSRSNSAVNRDGSSPSSMVNKVKQTAAEQLTNQKNRATEGLGTVAEAVRQSTQQLKDQQHDTIAHYAEQAANQIDRFSQQLRGKDVAELMGDLQRLSRKQPALFIGGAFAIGLLGARFLKSSTKDNSRPLASSSSGRGEYRGYARASGGAGDGSAGISQVHDYQAASAGPGDPSSFAGAPDINSPSDARDPAGSTADPRSRARRAAQFERS